MKLNLLSYTPNLELIVATAMLTTSSGALPSTLYSRMRENPEKAKEVVGRLEVQHGSILEHNRLVWRLDETDSRVLDTLLDCKFFNFTRLGGDSWLMSGNLRTVVEYSESHGDEFSEALVESIKDVAPTVHRFAMRSE
ncbi:MAG: hypothetical protein ACLFVP_09475 [Candidatus Bathyarchaeia archaeon]